MTNYIGPIPPVSMAGSLITWVERSRLLGVTVDNKLTWSPYLSEVKKSRECTGKFLFKSEFFLSPRGRWHMIGKITILIFRSEIP